MLRASEIKSRSMIVRQGRGGSIRPQPSRLGF